MSIEPALVSTLMHITNQPTAASPIRTSRYERGVTFSISQCCVLSTTILLHQQPGGGLRQHNYPQGPQRTITTSSLRRIPSDPVGPLQRLVSKPRGSTGALLSRGHDSPSSHHTCLDCTHCHLLCWEHEMCLPCPLTSDLSSL